MEKSMINAPLPDGYTNRQKMRGSAILYILIAIALLTALGVTLTKMSSNSAGNMKPEQAKSSAQQIIAYAKAVENSVQFVRTQNSCGLTQISAENLVSPSYTNPNSPADKRCHIFRPEGGGMEWRNPPSLSTVNKETWFIAGRTTSITGFGPEGSSTCAANCTDLILFLPNVNEAVCKSINFQLGITTSVDIIPADSYTTFQAHFLEKWIGVLGTSSGNRISNIGMIHYFKPAACVRTAGLTLAGTFPTITITGTPYLFYQLLVAR